MKVTIKGHKWKVFIVSPEEFGKIHGPENKDAAALTDTSNRQIWFRTDEINIVHVRHELVHANVSECRIQAANLSADQMEELCATIVGEDLVSINRMANRIHRWLCRPVVR